MGGGGKSPSSVVARSFDGLWRIRFEVRLASGESGGSSAPLSRSRPLTRLDFHFVSPVSHCLSNDLRPACARLSSPPRPPSGPPAPPRPASGALVLAGAPLSTRRMNSVAGDLAMPCKSNCSLVVTSIRPGSRQGERSGPRGGDVAQILDSFSTGNRSKKEGDHGRRGETEPVISITF